MLQLITLVIGGVLAIVLSLRWRSGRRRAPTVPYYIPWLGSALEIGKDPDGFVQRNTEKYGDLFAVQLAGKKVHYVTSPSLISTVYKKSKTFVFEPIRLGYMKGIFKLDPDVVHSESVREFNSLPHRFLAATRIGPLVSRYTHYTIQNILTLKGRCNPDVRLPLSSIIHTPLFSASTRSFYGSTFIPEPIYTQLQLFDKGVPFLAAGIPSIFLKETVRARGELGRLFGEYLEGEHEPCEMMEETERIAEEWGWSKETLRIMFFGMLWPLTANVPFAAFWLIALQLRRPEGLSELVEEIDRARKKWLDAHHSERKDFETDFEEFYAGVELPLLDSAVQEIYRYTTSSYSVRLVTEPTELTTEKGKTYMLNKGDTVMCITRSVHLDPSIYERPDEYNPRRFVVEGKFSGRDANLMPFGGGVSICEGRFFATAQVKIFIIFLLTYLQIELDPDSPLKAEFDMSKVGFGIIRNKGDVGVLIRARNIGGLQDSFMLV